MDHLFEVGEVYRNRNGYYEVLDIEEPKMRIRYEDGHEAVVTVATQARIWQAMKDEDEQAPKPVKKKGKRRRSWTKRGHEFTGLAENDFKYDTSGTDWRRRQSLGGLVALQLSEETSQFFQSYSVSRRPAVHVYLPDYFDPENGVPFAKNELRLSPKGARYGFYIERSDGKNPMDGTWHWPKFLNALEADEDLQEQLRLEMQNHGLFWLLQVEEGEGDNYSVVEEIEVVAGSPLLWNGTEEIEWTEFVDRLRDNPEQWFNAHLYAWTEKVEAIDEAEQFADQVTRVFNAILPLYLASTGA